MHRTMPKSRDARTHWNGQNGEKPTEPLPAIRGLMITCLADCFAPELLAHRLNEGEWLIHRTPAAILLPYGVADTIDEQLIERVVSETGVLRLVVCGHHPCACAAQLLSPDDSSRPGQTLRRVLTALPAYDHRIVSERAVLAQTANLLTHPAVAAAVAMRRLTLKTWLFDTDSGELLYPAAGETRFTRLVAQHPDHNAGLRPEFIRRPRSRVPIWTFDRAKLELA